MVIGHLLPSGLAQNPEASFLYPLRVRISAVFLTSWVSGWYFWSRSFIWLVYFCTAP